MYIKIRAQGFRPFRGSKKTSAKDTSRHQSHHADDQHPSHPNFRAISWASPTAKCLNSSHCDINLLVEAPNMTNSLNISTSWRRDDHKVEGEIGREKSIIYLYIPESTSISID